MKKKIAAIFTGLLLMFGGLVAFAPAAQAGTTSSCRVLDAGYGRTFIGTNYRYAAYCYVNYDWMEETFLGYRDGYKILWYSNDRCALKPWVGYISGC